MSKFIEITIITTHEASELIADIMWNYSSDGVAVNDFFDVIKLSETGKTWDYIDENVLSGDKRVFVKGYISVDDELSIKALEKDLISLKQNALIDVGSLETSKRIVDGDEWKEIWKEHFKPIHIGRVVIVPEWISYKESEGEIKILIGSNMAFGTGEHETTSMCVEFLDKLQRQFS